MEDLLYRIKSKHIRRIVALAVLGAITTWAWLMLRPLGYSYLQVFFGWLVISLAADRVRLWVEPWQQERRQLAREMR